MMEESSSEEELHDIAWEVESFFDYDDPHLTSPQMSAVFHSNIEQLKILLASGKSPNVVDNCGNTPLHISVLKNEEKIFDYLITVKDTRINVRNFEGATPLMFAVIAMRERYVEKLLEKGADVNTPLNNEDTPLHLSIGKSLTIAVMLIEKKADVNSPNGVGKTPLYIACEKEEWDFVHMLLYYGADARICDETGLLPFIYSLSECPHDEMQNILFNYSFDDVEDTVELKSLIMIIMMKSALFNQIIEKTSNILYSKIDLEYVSQHLPYIKAGMLKLLLEKFHKFALDFFDVCYIMSDFSHNITNLTNEDEIKNLIECFYVICESNFIDTVMAEYIIDKDLLTSIIQAKLPEDTLLKLSCCLLSYGFPLQCKHVNVAYRCYGFGKVFKMLLYMDMLDYSFFTNYKSLAENFIPQVIYDVNLYFDDFLRCPKKYVTDSVVKSVRKFFSIERNKVPSLLELSRETIRTTIIKTQKIRNNVHYFTALKRLQLGDIYKSILTYETAIYR